VADRRGLVVLIPVTIVSALYAPLAFLGTGWIVLVGVALWGTGMGLHESIVAAAVAHMVSPERRASAYGISLLDTGCSGSSAAPSWDGSTTCRLQRSSRSAWPWSS
jgi:predicted MFS family arabinose efflux permease